MSQSGDDLDKMDIETLFSEADSKSQWLDHTTETNPPSMKPFRAPNRENRVSFKCNPKLLSHSIDPISNSSLRIQAVYGYFDNVCMRAYMQFDLICVHFPRMTDLKWIFSNVNINSQSIGGVLFPDTCTNLLLNKQFPTLRLRTPQNRL